jgi:hypothetical protein
MPIERPPFPQCNLMQGGEHSPPFACKVLTRTFGNASGSSATTGRLLLRCRYVLPPESHFFSIFGVKCPYQPKKFRCSRKKTKKSKKMPSGRKTLYNPSGACQVRRRCLDCDVVRQCAIKKDEKPITKMSLSLCSKAASS